MITLQRLEHWYGPDGTSRHRDGYMGENMDLQEVARILPQFYDPHNSDY